MLSTSTWPDSVDMTAMLIVGAFMFLAPLLGYVFFVMDLRKAWRRLKGAMVVVGHTVRDLPVWTRKESPRCLEVFGLVFPCTTEDLLKAYRDQVKTIHPDRGGNKTEFHLLQRHFEQALTLLQAEDS